MRRSRVAGEQLFLDSLLEHRLHGGHIIVDALRPHGPAPLARRGLQMRNEAFQVRNGASASGTSPKNGTTCWWMAVRQLA
jgi:hypothetical protein